MYKCIDVFVAWYFLCLMILIVSVIVNTFGQFYLSDKVVLPWILKGHSTCSVCYFTWLELVISHRLCFTCWVGEQKMQVSNWKSHSLSLSHLRWEKAFEKAQTVTSGLLLFMRVGNVYQIVWSHALNIMVPGRFFKILCWVYKEKDRRPAKINHL